VVTQYLLMVSVYVWTDRKHIDMTAGGLTVIVHAVWSFSKSALSLLHLGDINLHSFKRKF
jgi:hypothetical protein